MAMTEFPLGDPLAVQRWSRSLAIEAAKMSYFSKFTGTDRTKSIIVTKSELSKAAGEKITIGLRQKLAADGIEGDNIIEGDAVGEEALNFFNDFVFIDQRRKSTKSKGKMTEQRVPYNLRREGRDALAVWWSEVIDEDFFIYLSGARGIDTSFKTATSWTGRANNAIVVPDAAHQIFSGDATSKADLDAADKISLLDIERLVAVAETTDPMIQGANVSGENKFVLVMHTYQAFDLRTSVTENDWIDIHKATDRGKGALMYKNALGEYADVIMHKHRNVIRFDDYGAGANVEAGRALFMGVQAGLVAYGQGSSKNRYSWNEDKDDRGNALAITAGQIYGIKRTIFDSATYGLIAVDSAAASVS